MAECPPVGATAPADGGTAVAVAEAQRLRDVLRQANIEIDRLRSEARREPDDSLLREANEQLVLALLRAQAGLPSLLEEQHPGPRAASLARSQLYQLQLQEANEQLLLAALGAQQLHSAAEQALGDQTARLALVAHELRNPLMPIRTAASLLDRAGAHEMPRLRAVIERQVDHVARLVGDLLDLSRVHAGKLRMERSVVDACAVVPEALEACLPAIEGRRQRLLIDIPVQPVLVSADRVRLVQVLCNLLDNASKYTPDEGTITLDMHGTATDLVIRIADTGIGISAQALATVFHPFVQESHATTFNGAGLGIGLTVVRELVEAHGGEVRASSAGEGHGSQFVVTIPRLAAGETPCS